MDPTVTILGLPIPTWEISAVVAFVTGAFVSPSATHFLAKLRSREDRSLQAKSQETQKKADRLIAALDVMDQQASACLTTADYLLKGWVGNDEADDAFYKTGLVADYNLGQLGHSLGQGDRERLQALWDEQIRDVLYSILAAQSANKEADVTDFREQLKIAVAHMQKWIADSRVKVGASGELTSVPALQPTQTP